MRLILIAAAGLLAAGAAFGQPLTSSSLAALDGNGDGAVDAGEFNTFLGKAFATTDADGSGGISAAEAAGVLSPELFAATDANGDGLISQDEFSARAQQDFAGADRDGNGILN